MSGQRLARRVGMLFAVLALAVMAGGATGYGDFQAVDFVWTAPLR
ncbi:hypothetical protein [Micromonospora zamorensis]|nr:hypothetical protein OG886_29410 [Micromonospora zamorensis]